MSVDITAFQDINTKVETQSSILNGWVTWTSPEQLSELIERFALFKQERIDWITQEASDASVLLSSIQKYVTQIADETARAPNILLHFDDSVKHLLALKIQYDSHHNKLNSLSKQLSTYSETLDLLVAEQKKY